MPDGWVLKAKTVRSKRFRLLYSYERGEFAQLVYCLINATMDSWGMLPADKNTLQAKLGPFDSRHSPDDYLEAVDLLVEVGLIYRWEHDGDPWIYLVGHDEEHLEGTRKRSKHSTIPRPDLERVKKESLDRFRTNSGPSPDLVRKVPDQLRTNSGPTPESSGPSLEKSAYGEGVKEGGGEGVKEGVGVKEKQTHTHTNQKPKNPNPQNTHSPAQLINNQGDSWELVSLLELSQVHHEAWGIEGTVERTRGDVRTRILEALREYGMDDCKRAIKGHKAKREGKDVQGIGWAFPPASQGTKRNHSRLDHAWFRDLVLAGDNLKPDKGKPKGPGKAQAWELEGRVYSREELIGICNDLMEMEERDPARMRESEKYDLIQRAQFDRMDWTWPKDYINGRLSQSREGKT